MGTNSANGNLASSIEFQSQNTGGGCKTNTSFKTLSSGTPRIGVFHTNPQSYLHLGNCDVAGSDPAIVFGKRLSNNGGWRNAYMGYTENFFFTIGDWGGSNAGPNTLTAHIAISYAAPYASILVGSNG